MQTAIELTPYDKNIIVNQDTYNVSDRYQQIPTTEIISEMEKYNNMKIVDFGAARVRKRDKQNKQKHFVIMQGDNSKMVDGTNMQFGIFNSSDRSSSLKIYLSIFRFVCSNGMVVSDNLMEPISIRHTKNNDWKHSIASLMDEYDRLKEKTQETIHDMMNQYMSYGDQGRLAERVAEELINPNITGELIDPRELTIAKRIEDTPKTLWATWNKIQEHMMNGGIRRIMKKEDPDEPGRLFDVVSNTHKITNEGLKIKLNRQLHDLVMNQL